MTPPDGASPRAQSNAILGKRYGRYELLVQLARGGMGTVAVGRLKGAHGFRRRVAVKTIHAHLAEDEKYARMFMREADLASRLHHPNVVPVVEFDEQDGELFLVMDYYPSVPLSTLMRRCSERGVRLPLKVAVELVADACAGLDAAHNLKDDAGNPLNIVHRDMTPSNLLVGDDGTAKVTDFGVARADIDKFGASTTGSLKGKFAYLSPEQIQMVSLDRRSDVFALGVVLFETLCLRRLFGGQSELEILNAIVRDAPADVREFRSDCPDELAAIVRRSLERDRDERFQSAGELRAALLALVPLLPSADRASFVRDLISGDLDARAKSIIDAEAILDASDPQRTAGEQPIEIEVDPVSSASLASVTRPTPAPAVTADTASDPSLRSTKRSKTWAIVALGAGLIVAAGLYVGSVRMRAPNALTPPSEPRPAALVTAIDAAITARSPAVAGDETASPSPESRDVAPSTAVSSAGTTPDAGVRRTVVRVGRRRPPVGARRCAEPPCDL